jgi:hypothetical protein
MKKLILSLLLTVGITTSALAETYTFVVPQKPGSGTTIWTEIVLKELQRFLPEDTLKLRNFPGARDIPAVNAFQNELRFDNTIVMVSHGGNGVSFLQEQVDYNYADWESIGMMNLNIIVGKRLDADLENIVFASKSGRVPDAMGMALLLCGPMGSIAEYTTCFKEHVNWVPGFGNGGDRRLAFKRGELTVDRENPAAYKKHVASNPDAEVWFHHGILQADGSHADDPNYPGKQMEILYEAKWGEAPSGPMYDSYVLVKSFRDALQKAFWVNAGNPNAEKLQKALLEMSKDEKAIAAIQKKVGKYDWVIGKQGNARRDTLMSFVTEESLRNLVAFSNNALNIKAVYKSKILGELANPKVSVTKEPEKTGILNTIKSWFKND